MNNRKRDLQAVRMAATLLIMTITLVISGCGSNNDEEVYEDAATESTETESTTQNDSGEASEYWWCDYNKIVPKELYNDLDEASQKMVDDYAENVSVEMESFEEKSLQETEFDLTYVYDSDGLDKVLGNSKEDVTYDDIRAAIDRLDTSAKVKEIYTTLADNLEKQYPSMDLRVWLKNLETMKINFYSKEFFEMKGQDTGSYSVQSNQINLRDDLEDMELTQDALEYQIIVHEMTHPLKLGNFKIDDTHYCSQFSTSPTNYFYTNEALNSILALRSYDQESTLIGYLLISHMYEVMIENMDNYSMQDYIDEDVSYLITKLNETNGDDQAIRMVNLIELWYKDKKDDTTYIPPSFYYDLYDYIARMYYRNHITKDMTSEEIEKVKDDLVARLVADLSENTRTKEFDENHFDDYLKEYCRENGIEY